MIPNQIVEIDYVNWRGKRSIRRILPLTMHFASSRWRPESQGLVNAEDLGRGELRDFAMTDIKSWKPAP